LLIAHIEGISQGEGGANTACHCPLISDGPCAVNNYGPTTCGGGPSGNCWEYNQNCD
jgi:hypothetical protein